MNVHDEETNTEYGAYRLAGMADCASPDSLTSAGAQFLTSIHDAWHEAKDYDTDMDEAPDSLYR
jgi:hypothetical protein